MRRSAQIPLVIPHVHLVVQPGCVDCLIQVEELEGDEVKVRHDAAADLLLLVDLASVGECRIASKAWQLPSEVDPSLTHIPLDLLVPLLDHLEPLPDEVVRDVSLNDDLDAGDFSIQVDEEVRVRFCW